MPIRGLTSDRQRMLPRIGKIHLGVKVQHANGSEYPRAVDYFVFPDEVKPVVDQVYGPEPRELDIIFPSDDLEIIAPAWYKAYLGTGQAVCRGDGQTAERMIYDDQAHQVGPDRWEGEIARARRNDQNRERPASRYTIACPGRECEYYGSKECSEVMHLQFLVPKLKGSGIWQLDTGSYWSITQIYDAIAYFQLFGPITGRTFRLILEPRQITRPDGGSNTVYTLHLRHEGTFYEMLEAAQEPAWQALPEGSVPAADESRNELLYPVNGFAPDDVPPHNPATGEVIDEPPKTGNAGALQQANAGESLSGAERLERDLADLVTAYDYTDFVRNLPDGQSTWVRQTILKSAEGKGFIYSTDHQAFIADLPAEVTDPQPDEPDEPSDWVDDTDPPDAMSAANPKSCATPGCDNTLHPMDTDGICANCRRWSDQQAQADEDEVNDIIPAPIPQEQAGLLPE